MMMLRDIAVEVCPVSRENERLYKRLASLVREVEGIRRRLEALNRVVRSRRAAQREDPVTAIPERWEPPDAWWRM